MGERVPVQTAQRTFEVVEAIDDLGGGSFSDLLDTLDMPKSSLHDYLSSLTATGYVVREDGRYEVGTRFLELGNRARNRMEIYHVAKPEIEKLADRTGEHASLMIREDTMGVLLYMARGEDAVNLGALPGEHLPLTVTAPGKAILAHLPESALDRVIEDQGLPKVTEASITDRETLEEELAEVRDRGYATEMGEAVRGVRAASVPIRDGDVLGAITIGGPTNRMNGDRFSEEVPTLLMRASNVIEVNYSGST